MKAEKFQELVARIKSRVSLLFPSPMQAVELVATNISIEGVKQDQFDRYPVTIGGVALNLGLHKSTSPDGLKTVDAVKYEATEEFTIDGKTFEKGFESIKLVTPGSFVPAKAKSTKEKATVTA